MNPKKSVTLKDLADALDVSVSVVSRVLSGKAKEYRISDDTEKAVRVEAKRRGFSVNHLARSLRLKKTRTVGLLVPDISNSFFSTIAQSVESVARKRGYSVILCDTEGNEDIERTSLEFLASRTVDGFLVAPVGLTSDHIVAIAKNDTPLVLLDRFFPDTGLPYVTSDNFQGAYEGARYLLEKGHRSIGFVQGVPECQTSIERLKGYQMALMQYDVPFRQSLVAGVDFAEQRGYDSTLALLKRKPRPTALFVSSAVGALGAMRACAESKLRIPHDISIIGFDDYPYAPLLSPPLTTIAQKSEAIGRIASDLLLEWLELGKRPEEGGVVLKTSLVARASVREITPES